MKVKNKSKRLFSVFLLFFCLLLINSFGFQQKTFVIATEIPQLTKTATVRVGKKKRLKLTGTKEKVTWSSSNKKIAKVNKKGKIKGIRKGTATITAKIGNKTLTCQVTVKPTSTTKVDPSSVEISRAITYGFVPDEIQGEYPISVHHMEDTYVLFTNKAYRIYNASLELINTHLYGNRQPIKYKVTEKNVVVSYGLSSISKDTSIEVAYAHNKEVKYYTVQSSISDFEINDDFLYCLSDNSMEIFSLSKGKREKSANFDKKYYSITKINDDKLLLLRPDEVRFFFETDN